MNRLAERKQYEEQYNMTIHVTKNVKWGWVEQQVSEKPPSTSTRIKEKNHGLAEPHKKVSWVTPTRSAARIQ